MNLYNDLFRTYFYISQMLYPKDGSKQREYLLVRTGLLADKMSEAFEKVGGVKLLAKCRSAKEIITEERSIQHNIWPKISQISHNFIVMSKDENLSKQLSLNKTAFIVDKKIRKEKGLAEVNTSGNRKQNDPNYRELWREYRGASHLINAYAAMKLDFLEKDNPYKIPLEVFIAMNLKYFLNRAFLEGEKLKGIIEPRLKKPIIPADEFVAVSKVDISEDDLNAILLPAICHVEDMEELNKIVSNYRAPISV